MFSSQGRHQISMIYCVLLFTKGKFSLMMMSLQIPIVPRSELPNPHFPIMTISFSFLQRFGLSDNEIFVTINQHFGFNEKKK